MTRKRSQGPSQRQLRVGEALRHALVEILARDELRDPALSGIQVTVTEVRVSPDLRAGTAFVLPFGGGDAAALASALNRAAGYFRKTLADSVELRVAPTIRFEPDLKRQRIVDSWPADVDDDAARKDWGFAPRYDLERAFSEYLVPTIRERYR